MWMFMWMPSLVKSFTWTIKMKKQVKQALPLLCGGAFLAGMYGLFGNDPELLHAEEAVDMMESRYKGEVTAFQALEDTYTMQLTAADGTYQIDLHPVTGEVLSFDPVSEQGLEQQEEEESEKLEPADVEAIVSETAAGAVITEMELKEGEQNVYDVVFSQDGATGRLEIDAYSGDIELFTLEETAPVDPIDRDKAAALAVKAFEGEVDDIDLEEKNGRLVYEIEVENEAADREADVIIDAYSGEVLEIVHD